MISFVLLVVASFDASLGYRNESSDRFNYSLNNKESNKISSLPEFCNISYSNNSCLINESIQCPPWSYCDGNHRTCKCYRNNVDIFKCDIYGNRNAILSCYCLTFNEKRNTTYEGLCFYNCYYLYRSKFDSYSPYNVLPNNMSALNDAMCGRYNRTGTLCGKCVSSTYLHAYSYDMSCTDCTGGFSNWIKYFFVVYAPLTLFYMVVLLFKINIPSSHLQGYVLLSQVISSPILLRAILIYLRDQTDSILYKSTQLLATIHGIWNLDFFRLLSVSICFEASPLTILSLDFFVALYPLLLMVVTYKVISMHDSNNKVVMMIFWPFKRAFRHFKHNLDIKTSTIDSFATFMFLSHIKFLNVCFDLLLPVQVCETSSNRNCTWAVFHDATMTYFGQEHLPYAIPAILVLLMFVLGPVFILVLYPFTMS